MLENEFFIQRCFDLAKLGSGYTSPNPAVGAVLVHEGRIIGEGYHKKYRQAHAEVNALASVKTSDIPLIPQSTLYVSLEPCCIHGHTPPCTSLILDKRIPQVVISAFDHTPGVNGQGVQLLRQAGVAVTTSVMADRGERLSAPRNVFATRHRPYIILKYAKTADGFMARKDNRPAWISSEYSKRLVHKWRSESDAIMVGTHTALVDNPSLTNRYYFGKSPLRIVPDRDLSLPPTLSLFDPTAPTLVASRLNKTNTKNITYLQIPDWGQMLTVLLDYLYKAKIGILLVEGGPALLSSFIIANYWDEARVFTSPAYWHDGLRAPLLPSSPAITRQLGPDTLEVFFNNALI